MQVTDIALSLSTVYNIDKTQSTMLIIDIWISCKKSWSSFSIESLKREWNIREKLKIRSKRQSESEQAEIWSLGAIKQFCKVRIRLSFWHCCAMLGMLPLKLSEGNSNVLEWVLLHFFNVQKKRTLIYFNSIYTDLPRKLSE